MDGWILSGFNLNHWFHHKVCRIDGIGPNCSVQTQHMSNSLQYFFQTQPTLSGPIRYPISSLWAWWNFEKPDCGVSVENKVSHQHESNKQKMSVCVHVLSVTEWRNSELHHHDYTSLDVPANVQVVFRCKNTHCHLVSDEKWTLVSTCTMVLKRSFIPLEM